MNAEYYDRQKARQREKYANDPEYRKYHQDYSKKYMEQLRKDSDRWKVYAKKRHEYYIKRKIQNILNTPNNGNEQD